MSTIYTVNNKVLKNSVTDKWLIKKEAPSFQEITIGNQIWMSKNWLLMMVGKVYQLEN